MEHTRLIDILKINGIKPERLRDYLKVNQEVNWEIFELIRSTLPQSEANKREIELLNGDIFYSIISRGCL